MLDTVRLPVRIRTLVRDRTADETSRIVHCPAQKQSVDARACVGCARLRSIEWSSDGGVVECRPQSGDIPAAPETNGPDADLAEAAARSTLHEVVSPVTVCIHSTTTVERVRALLIERGLRAAPVVDDELKLVGVVSRSDLLAAPLDTLPVHTVMSPRVHSLPEDAPIGWAIALMAVEDVHEVPVATLDGELVGMWTATDALRWTARQMGYVELGTGS